MYLRPNDILDLFWVFRTGDGHPWVTCRAKSYSAFARSIPSRMLTSIADTGHLLPKLHLCEFLRQHQERDSQRRNEVDLIG